MEFEFERRRVTKEDVRELIYREILEYHPQLRKDYINGIERTTFLYPSAIDHFKNHFAHLEGSVGKSGPVIPLERKHASLPRSSTIVHSASVPQKNQPAVANARDRLNSEESRSKNSRDSDSCLLRENLTSYIQNMRKTAKPGRVVGPVLAYENPNWGRMERPMGETGRDYHTNAKQASNCSVPAKLAPDVTIDIDHHPYFTSRAGGTMLDCPGAGSS